MKTSNNKKAYQSPKTTAHEMRMSAHILSGSAADGLSVGSNLGGLGGFGGGLNPINAD